MGTKRALSYVDGTSESGSAPPQEHTASSSLVQGSPEIPSGAQTRPPSSHAARGLALKSSSCGPPAPTSVSDLPDALPPELLRAVSSRQKPGTGYITALVSKRWLHLSPKAQQSVRVRDGALLQIDDLLFKILSFTSLTSLELGFCSIDRLDDAAFAKIAAAWPSLRSLSIHPMAAFLRCEVASRRALDALLSHCRGLRHLALQQQSVSPLTLPELPLTRLALQMLRLGTSWQGHL